MPILKELYIYSHGFCLCLTLIRYDYIHGFHVCMPLIRAEYMGYCTLFVKPILRVKTHF